MGKCDQCGQEVPLNNSVLKLREIVRGKFAGFFGDRHLFPTGECEGSPGRARLVKTDPVWAMAYQELQECQKNSLWEC